MYFGMISAITQQTTPTIRIIPAILAYVLMFVSLAFIVFPQIAKTTSIVTLTNMQILSISIQTAGILGFVIYGIYNATNAALFNNYPIQVAIIDTLWGTLLYTFATYISLILVIKIFKVTQ